MPGMYVQQTVRGSHHTARTLRVSRRRTDPILFPRPMWPNTAEQVILTS